MGRDKGSMVFPPRQIDQREYGSQLLGLVCEKVFVSVHPGQENLISSALPTILDSIPGEGPGVGILSAALSFPEVSFKRLIQNRF